MKGRILDAILVIGWLAAIIVVAIVHPGLANLLIAVLGAIGLGWYDAVIRRDPKRDELRGPWRLHRAEPADAGKT